jgi:hypothetical protein
VAIPVDYMAFEDANRPRSSDLTACFVMPTTCQLWSLHLGL